MSTETKPEDIALFFDHETTGVPDWHSPSDGENQPHIVEIGAALVNLKTREIIETYSAVVKPDGWVIPDDVVAIHGISQEFALESGIPEAEAISKLLDMKSRAAIRIAHSINFDDRITRIALKRYRDDRTQPEGTHQPSDAWKDGEKFCTASGSRELCALPKKKIPTLQEAHAHLVGHEPETLHRALPDVLSCIAVYFAIQDAKQAQAA